MISRDISQRLAETWLTVQDDVMVEQRMGRPGAEYAFTRKEIELHRHYAGRTVGYYALSNLSRTGSLRIAIASQGDYEEVQLPAGMTDNIAAYLRTRHGDSRPFNCAAFVYTALGIPPTVRTYQTASGKPYCATETKLQDWRFTEIGDADGLRPGDPVFVSWFPRQRSAMDFTHVALYIDWGLFLSKCGDFGPLIATDFDGLQNSFGGHHVFHAEPLPSLMASMAGATQVSG